MPRIHTSRAARKRAVSIGKRITAARQTAGISVRALATRLGMHHSTLYRLEAGNISQSLNDLDRIARVLGIAVTTLAFSEAQIEAKAS